MTTLLRSPTDWVNDNIFFNKVLQTKKDNFFNAFDTAFSWSPIGIDKCCTQRVLSSVVNFITVC